MPMTGGGESKDEDRVSSLLTHPHLLIDTLLLLSLSFIGKGDKNNLSTCMFCFENVLRVKRFCIAPRYATVRGKSFGKVLSV